MKTTRYTVKMYTCMRSFYLWMSALLLAILILSLSVQPAHAGSATWKSNPANSQWYNPNNWTPSTVPDGTTDIATFGATTIPAVTISGSSDGFIMLKGITFNSDASVYILTLPPGFNNLTLQDRGVVNNSGRTQNFVINGGINTDLTFQDATAGNDVSYNMIGSTNLDFTGTATAGNAAFTCNNTSGTFLDSATAGSASFTLNGTSNILFLNDSSADNGIFVLNGSESGGASITFTNGGHAGRGTFTINGTGGSSNTVYVSGALNSSADAAVFTANGAVDMSHSPGVVMLVPGGDPASATFIANAGLNGGNGGLVDWVTVDRSQARVEVFGSGNGDITNGTLDLSGLDGSSPAVVGSLEGTGLVQLGQTTLSVGSNNSSTTFGGMINDAGGGANGSGSLTKTGSGTFTLSQANTYTGKTTVVAGTLLVTNRTGSATGTGPVIVNGGVLGGTGKISGAVTVGSATRFGTIAPGLVGRTGRLTTSSTITFKQFGIYNADLDSNSVKADQVVATGVTITSGATANIADLGTGTLTSGTVFTIINNTSAIPISGTFSNLADGSTLTIGNNTYRVNYEGGTGNDLTLMVQ
jgi:fibronectin-binding autotransporter adhesin